MTYPPRIPAKPVADCTGVRRKTTASYTASTTVRVTKAREKLN
jgi:hypothetical protein